VTMKFYHVRQRHPKPAGCGHDLSKFTIHIPMLISAGHVHCRCSIALALSFTRAEVLRWQRIRGMYNVWQDVYTIGHAPTPREEPPRYRGPRTGSSCHQWHLWGMLFVRNGEVALFGWNAMRSLQFAQD